MMPCGEFFFGPRDQAVIHFLVFAHGHTRLPQLVTESLFLSNTMIDAVNDKNQATPHWFAPQTATHASRIATRNPLDKIPRRYPQSVTG
jgi:hypothetical protein